MSLKAANVYFFSTARIIKYDGTRVSVLPIRSHARYTSGLSHSSEYQKKKKNNAARIYLKYAYFPSSSNPNSKWLRTKVRYLLTIDIIYIQNMIIIESSKQNYQYISQLKSEWKSARV